MKKYKVVRDRNSYLVVDGDGNKISGFLDPLTANWSALFRNYPWTRELAQAFENKHFPLAQPGQNLRYRQIESRLLNAVYLVAKGHVRPNGTPVSYDVVSQSRPNRVYRVRFGASNKRWTCTIYHDPGRHIVGNCCPDIAHKAPDLGRGKRCKHMLAAALVHQFPDLAKSEVSTSVQVETSKVSGSPPTNTDSTTNATSTQRTPAAWYSDGRIAAYDDGTLIRYTDNGRAVEITVKMQALINGRVS